MAKCLLVTTDLTKEKRILQLWLPKSGFWAVIRPARLQHGLVVVTECVQLVNSTRNKIDNVFYGQMK